MRPQIATPIIFAGARFSLFDIPNLVGIWDTRVKSSFTPYAACSLDGSTQYLTKTTSGINTALSGLSYYVAGWVNLANNAGANQIIVIDGNANGTGVAGTFEFYLRSDHNAGSPKFTWVVSNYDLTGGTVTTAGTYAYGSKHFVIAYFNVTNGTIGISVDGGAFETASFTVGGAGAVVAEMLRFGASTAATPDQFVSGTLDECVIATAASGAPSTAERDIYYNSGSGTAIESLSGLTFTIISSWKMRETGATARVDGPGSLDLAATGTPPATTSLITGQLVQDGDLVKQWNDLTTNGRHYVQATPANALTYKENVHHTLPGLLGNIAGSARMTMTNPPTLAAATFYAVHRPALNTGTSQAMMAGATGAHALSLDGSNPPKPRLLRQNATTITTAATGSTVSATELMVGAYDIAVAGAVVLERNGTSVAGAVTDPAAFSATTAELGSRSSGTADFYGGHFQLNIISSQVNSSDIRAKATALLRQEWRI